MHAEKHETVLQGLQARWEFTNSVASIIRLLAKEIYLRVINLITVDMGKKIVSFALSKKAIERLNKTSKALGVSRSELLEFMIKKGWHFPGEVQEAVDKISKLQKQAKAKMGGEMSQP